MAIRLSEEVKADDYKTIVSVVGMGKDWTVAPGLADTSQCPSELQRPMSCLPLRRSPRSDLNASSLISSHRIHLGNADKFEQS